MINIVVMGEYTGRPLKFKFYATLKIFFRSGHKTRAGNLTLLLQYSSDKSTSMLSIRQVLKFCGILKF